MANQLKTRILNKISTWTEWESVKSTFKPLRGEICIVEIPTGTASTGLTPPAVGIKVGNGTDFFGDLPWIQAIAGDVTAWCKENMADFNKFKAQVEAAVADSEGGLQDAIDALSQRVTNLEATVNNGDNSNANLRQAITAVDGKADANAQNITGLTSTKADKTQVATDIAAAKTAVLGQKDGADFNGTVMGAYDAAATAKDAADAASATASQALTDAKAYTDQKATAILGEEGYTGTVKGAYEAATAAQGTANTNAGEITAIKEDIEEINNMLGGTDGSSVNERLTALETTTGEHTNKIQDNTDAIGAEVTRATNAEEALGIRIAKAEAFLNDANLDTDGTNVIDTLKEIQQYISEDESGASAMAASITDTKKKLLGTEDLDTYYGAEGYNIISVKTLAQKGVDDAATAKNAADNAQAAAEAADAKADTNLATAKTYAEDQAAAVLGTDGDAAGAATVHGALKSAVNAAQAASVADGKAVAADGKAVAAQAAADEAKDRLDALAASPVNEGNGKISTISFDATGKMTTTRKQITMADMDADTVFIFNCGTATVNADNLTV